MEVLAPGVLFSLRFVIGAVNQCFRRRLTLEGVPAATAGRPAFARSVLYYSHNFLKKGKRGVRGAVGQIRLPAFLGA